MRVRAVHSAVPRTAWDAETVAALTDTEVGFIRDKVGAARRYILADGETGTDLSVEACRPLLEGGALRPEEVKLLVVVTPTPDYRIPHNSALLQPDLGYPRRNAAASIRVLHEARSTPLHR